MDQNQTLRKLLEAADLAKMVEELVSPGHIERLSPAGLSGIRITLRALRETMLACHDVVATDQSNRSRPRADVPAVEGQGVAPNPGVENPAIVRQTNGADQPRMVRKDLRSTLGQMIERSAS